MILKYSDLKGRTDLVGRKVRAVPGINNPCSELQDDGSNTAIITSITDWIVCIDYCVHTFADEEFLELLDEEPARPVSTQWDSLEGQTHSYNDGCGHPAHNDPAGTYEGVPMKGNPVDTRTEITWENATMEDKVGYWASNGKIKEITIRDYIASRNALWFVQPNEKLDGMTYSQIEERQRHKVEIVE